MKHAELAAVLDSGLAYARTARIPHRCVTADELHGHEVIHEYEIPVLNAKSWSRQFRTTLLEAEQLAGRLREEHPGEKVTVEPVRNRNYPAKAEGCRGDIPVGDLYVEYVGESAFAQSGRAYCVPCGLNCWSRA